MYFRPMKKYSFLENLINSLQKLLQEKYDVNSSMQFYPLFRMVKNAGLHRVLLKNYLKIPTVLLF